MYDMALQSLLPSPADHPTLLAVAKSWPPGAFSMAALADAVAARLRRLQQQQQAAATAATAATAARGGGGGGTGGAAGGAGASGAAPLPAVDVGGGEGGAADPLWQLLAWLYEQQVGGWVDGGVGGGVCRYQPSCYERSASRGVSCKRYYLWEGAEAS